VSVPVALGRHLPVVVAVLGVLVLGSGIAAVYAKHQSRKLFVELQVLTAERDRLDLDWGRRGRGASTHANHARVEQLARSELGMRLPDPREIQLVAP
jgi:cell division protein FtsL